MAATARYAWGTPEVVKRNATHFSRAREVSCACSKREELQAALTT
jgi:hypothetical protein